MWADAKSSKKLLRERDGTPDHRRRAVVEACGLLQGIVDDKKSISTAGQLACPTHQLVV